MVLPDKQKNRLYTIMTNNPTQPKPTKKPVNKKPTKVTNKLKKETPIKLRDKSELASTKREFQFNVCLWLAMGMTTNQVVDRAKDRMGIKVSYQNINKTYRYGEKWVKVIRYLRERYLRNLSRIPIANKEMRIAALQDVYKEAMTWRTKTITAYGKVKEIKIGVALQALDAVRREIEGDKGVTFNIKNEDNRKYQRYEFKGKSGDEIAEFLTPLLKNRIKK